MFWPLVVPRFRPSVKKRISVGLSSRGTGVTTRSPRGTLRRNPIDEELDYFRKRRKLGIYQDRRLHEYGVQPAKGVISVSHRLVAVPRQKDIFEEQKGLRKAKERVGFYRPWRVIICARRRMRREVLHAFRRTGAGAGTRFPKQKPKYNEYSPIVCYGG